MRRTELISTAWRRRSSEEVRSVAYHEAGHCIASPSGSRIRYATINATEEGSSDGHVAFVHDRNVWDYDPRWWDPRDLRRIAREHLRCDLAGTAAEQILGGYPSRSFGYHFISLVQDPDRVDGDMGSAGQWARLAFPGQDPEGIVRTSYRATLKYLRANWTSVVAVAEALREKRRLSAMQILAALPE